MTVATYVIEVDWEADGTYGHANADITAEVQRVDATRGRTRASPLLNKAAAGRMRVRLRNNDGKYSPSNSGSPLAGLLLPKRAIRLRTTAPSAVTLWTGNIDRINPISQLGVAEAEIVALGVLAEVKAKKTTTAPLTAPVAKDIIDDVLDDVGIAAGARAIDTGQSTLSRIWFEDRDALRALREIEDAEQGFLYEGVDAKVVFEDRHHRMKSPHLTPQATWSDAPAAALSYSEIRQADPLKDIVNDVRNSVPAYTVATIAVVWTLNETPTIAPGETKTWWAEYPDAASPSGRYVETWTTPDATDVTVTGVAFGDLGIVPTKFAQSMKLEITNNGGATATLDLLRARGTAVTEDEPTVITSEDATSQTAFGKRTFAPSARWLANTNDAQAIADYIISRYRDPIALLRVTMAANRSTAAMTDALTRTISDRVTVVADNDTQLGINGDFFIESVRHRIDRGGTRHMVEYLLSEVDPQTYWVLGTNTLGTGANPGRLAA